MPRERSRREGAQRLSEADEAHAPRLQPTHESPEAGSPFDVLRPGELACARAATSATAPLSSRRIANVYLVASACGIMATIVRSITALVPPLQGPVGAYAVWLFACMCGVGFALTSAHAWRQKVKWFQRPAVSR